MFEYKAADLEGLNCIWDKNIASNHGDKRWRQWKKEYVKYNLDGTAKTFIVYCNGDPIGEGTLLFNSDCKAVNGRLILADCNFTANINALRIQKEHEGKGHISKLVHMMEQYARDRGYKYLTIGVEARETRNLAIYLHWGYDEFVLSEVDGGSLILYYRKRL